MKTVFVIGPTNAGKSTIIERVKEVGWPVVEVGKMMRAKYPPDYFKGQASPAHTASEAWAMMLGALSQHYTSAEKRICFIDGQPRDMEQAAKIVALFPDALFFHVSAPREDREKRALARDGDDPAKLTLSLQRMDNDCVGLYNVITFLNAKRANVMLFYNKDCADADLQKRQIDHALSTLLATIDKK